MEPHGAMFGQYEYLKKLFCEYCGVEKNGKKVKEDLNKILLFILLINIKTFVVLQHG